jgi:hypothetical protein
MGTGKNFVADSYTKYLLYPPPLILADRGLQSYKPNSQFSSLHNSKVMQGIPIAWHTSGIFGFSKLFVGFSMV